MLLFPVVSIPSYSLLLLGLPTPLPSVISSNITIKSITII